MFPLFDQCSRSPMFPFDQCSFDECSFDQCSHSPMSPFANVLSTNVLRPMFLRRMFFQPLFLLPTKCTFVNKNFYPSSCITSICFHLYSRSISWDVEIEVPPSQVNWVIVGSKPASRHAGPSFWIMYGRGFQQWGRCTFLIHDNWQVYGSSWRSLDKRGTERVSLQGECLRGWGP